MIDDTPGKRSRAPARSALALALVLGLLLGGPASAEIGVSADTIRIGGVMDLEGDSRGLGLGMKAGIEAALRDVTVQGRHIEFVTENDSYSPAKTVEATKKLVDEGVFAMVGNVGTPTARVALPILAQARVPAVGFFTGAGILRPGEGDVINFRASYVQETAAVIESAVAGGLDPREICAYVQNDGYGMAGVEGIRRALAPRAGMEEVVALLERVMAMTGDDPARNNVGPVGVYRRNTLYSRDGYESLKAWEKTHETRCGLVVSVGTYEAIARFTAYSRYRGDRWVVSAVSFTGADNFRRSLEDFRIADRVIMTQVVPPLDSGIPVVEAARATLGDDFGHVTLEGYIVGRMVADALQRIEGDITRAAFLDALRGHTFNLDGLPMDFSRDNQGSDFVSLTRLTPSGYVNMSTVDWPQLLRD